MMIREWFDVFFIIYFKNRKRYSINIKGIFSGDGFRSKLMVMNITLDETKNRPGQSLCNRKLDEEDEVIQ